MNINIHHCPEIDRFDLVAFLVNLVNLVSSVNSATVLFLFIQSILLLSEVHRARSPIIDAHEAAVT